MSPSPVDEVSRGISRLIRAGKNVRIHDTFIERALRDHEQWIKEQHAAVNDALLAINYDCERRGIFNSGIRLADRVKRKEEALTELRKQRNRLADQLADYRNDETWLERVYRRLKRRPMLQFHSSDVAAEIETIWRSAEVDPSGLPVIEVPPEDERAG